MLFRNHMLRTLGLSLALTLVNAWPVWAISAAEEYEIKAVYLFNLGRFVYWPESTLPKGGTFRVCVLGQDPFGDVLDFVANEVKVMQQHPVDVQRVNTPENVSGCHILFISDSEQLRLSYIFQQLRQQPVLLVSDMDRFIIDGGMVQFYRRGTKVRLMLDPESIADAQLKPSAQLMRIATTTK